MPIGGRLFDRFGARPLVVPGLILASTAMWLLSGLSATTTAAGLRVPLALMGAGMGLMMMPLSTHILNTAPRHLVSRVTSLTGALQNVVASLAIASYATYLQGRITAGMTALAASGGLPGVPGGAGRPTIGAEGAPSTGALGGAAGQLPPPVAAVFADAFGDVYGVAMVVAGLAIVFALTLRRRAPAPHQSGAAAPVPEMVVG